MVLQGGAQIQLLRGINVFGSHFQLCKSKFWF